jgi:hypothetical protein
MKFSFIIIFFFAILLTGCETGVQTSSGREYLDRTPYEPKNDVDKEVAAIANVEPLLRFPARIGLARVDRGELTSIPTEELDAWAEATKELGSEFGEFVPVSRLVTAMVKEKSQNRNRYRHPDDNSNNGLYEIINSIRLGAARQHLDVVLIYEVYGSGKTYLTTASIANLTIIGAYILPGRKLKSKGFASALLLDVRNGYPYGTASAEVDEKAFAVSINSYEKSLDLTEKAKICAGVKLIPEIKTMMIKLKKELKVK